MTKEEKNVALQNIKESVERLDKKDFTFYFFVMDTKGNPSGSLAYIYRTAYALKELHYNVMMLHQEKEFVGVESWLGEKYASLQHVNVETDNVEIRPSDFLFIPEIYANVMSQTKNLPCKKIAILQNQSYLTSTIPVGVTWDDMNIKEVVTNTRANEALIKTYFPQIKTHVVEPCIPNVFRPSTEPQKLIINVVSKEQSNVDKIIKPFYWLYPVYKWVSFRDVRGLPEEILAEALNTAAITIWIDDETDFGYSCLEALRSGTIVIAKIPDNPTDWMLDENGNLIEGPIWFNNLRDLPRIISSVVRTWTLDNIPDEIYDDSMKTKEWYTPEQFNEQIADVYLNDIKNRRKHELQEAYDYFSNELNKE